MLDYIYFYLFTLPIAFDGKVYQIHGDTHTHTYTLCHWIKKSLPLKHCSP